MLINGKDECLFFFLVGLILDPYPNMRFLLICPSSEGRCANATLFDLSFFGGAFAQLKASPTTKAVFRERVCGCNQPVSEGMVRWMLCRWSNGFIKFVCTVRPR